MGLTSDSWHDNSLAEVLAFKETLSLKATRLLRIILSTKCKGKAEIRLRRFKTQNVSPTLFASMYNCLAEPWGNADRFSRGWIVANALAQLKCKPGTNVQAFNREYQSLFDELSSLEFAANNIQAVIAYLTSFQISDSSFEAARTSILSDPAANRNLSLAISRVEQVVAHKYPSFIFPPESFAGAVTNVPALPIAKEVVPKRCKERR